MERTKNKKISLISTILLTLIMVLSIFISIAPVEVNAATKDNETLQVQGVVDNATFITFRKGENSSYGRFIFCCYYNFMLGDICFFFEKVEKLQATLPLNFSCS